jgi:hypothetical protein
VSDQTPTFIARCKECQHVIAAAVASLENDNVLRAALRARAEWKRKGYLVETVTVERVRLAAFGHHPTCQKRTAKQRSLLARVAGEAPQG